MEQLLALSKALELVLAQDEDFATEEIVEAARYALHKYGHNYPALGEVIVEIINQNRFSDWTFEDCRMKMDRARA